MKRFISILLITSAYTFEISNAVGEYGAVASSKKAASEIGVEILKNGGKWSRFEILTNLTTFPYRCSERPFFQI